MLCSGLLHGCRVLHGIKKEHRIGTSAAIFLCSTSLHSSEQQDNHFPNYRPDTIIHPVIKFCINDLQQSLQHFCIEAEVTQPHNRQPDRFPGINTADQHHDRYKQQYVLHDVILIVLSPIIRSPSGFQHLRLNCFSIFPLIFPFFITLVPTNRDSAKVAR